MAQIKDINRIVLVCLEDARARSSFDVLEIMIQRKSRPAPRKSQRQMVFCYAHFTINTMDFYLVRSLGLSRRQWIRIRSIIHVHDVDQATTTTLRPTLYFNSQQGRRIRMQLCHGENCVQQPKKNPFTNPRIVLPRYKNSLWISPKSKVSCECIVYLISKLFFQCFQLVDRMDVGYTEGSEGLIIHRRNITIRTGCICSSFQYGTYLQSEERFIIEP